MNNFPSIIPYDKSTSLPPISKEELQFFPDKIISNFRLYTNAFWAFADISRLILYRDEILSFSSPPIDVSLDELYRQLYCMMEKIEKNCETMCLEEAIAYSFRDEIERNKKQGRKNIFVPDKDFFKTTLQMIDDDLIRIREKAQTYKKLFMATIYDVDEMDGRTFKKFLMLLYARLGYSITPIKQKNMFYAEKNEERFILQGKIGKITQTTARKYYDSCPKDAPLILISNVDHSDKSSVPIIGREELENYMLEVKGLLNYKYLNDDFKKSVCDAVYHTLTVALKEGDF